MSGKDKYDLGCYLVALGLSVAFLYIQVWLGLPFLLAFIITGVCLWAGLWTHE